MPEIGIEEIESLYYEELKRGMSITYIALYDAIPVGSCTLQLNDDIRPDLGPWVGNLVVDLKYQKQGIGKMLVDVAVLKAKELGFEKTLLKRYYLNLQESTMTTTFTPTLELAHKLISERCPKYVHSICKPSSTLTLKHMRT